MYEDVHEWYTSKSTWHHFGKSGGISKNDQRNNRKNIMLQINNFTLPMAWWSSIEPGQILCGFLKIGNPQKIKKCLVYYGYYYKWLKIVFWGYPLFCEPPTPHVRSTMAAVDIGSDLALLHRFAPLPQGAHSLRGRGTANSDQTMASLNKTMLVTDVSLHHF